MTRIGVREALGALQQAVDKYGRETRYADRDADYGPNVPGQACRYVDPSSHKPLCIVGVALVEFLGVEPSRFLCGNDSNTRRVAGLVGRGSNDSWMPYVFSPEEISPEAVSVFQIAQQVQDTHGTWGRAVDEASHYALGSLGVSA